jgi:spore germination protein GerM
MPRIAHLAALAVAVALATVVAGWTSPSRTAVADPLPQRDAGVHRPTPQPPRQTIRVYFVKGERFAPVERRVAPAGPAAVAARAVEWLLAGPNRVEHRRGLENTIAAGTRLGSLRVANGTATLALTASPAAPTATDVSLRPARAAQLVYTLTDLSGVERVVIHVNGSKRATFADRDLAVGRALDRGSLSRPIQLEPQPARVPAGAAPVDVVGVQKRLASLTYLPPAGVTGSWDHRTEQAVLAFQSWHGLARDGVVGPQTVACLEAATPPKPSSNGEGRRIEVHRAKGVVLLLDGASVIRTVHASTGAPGYETPTGAYTVFRKEANSWSFPYQVWLPYASYFNGGIAFHASDDVPARAASHGCVRLPAPEAPFVYEFATLGTPVLVY